MMAAQAAAAQNQKKDGIGKYMPYIAVGGVVLVAGAVMLTRKKSG